MSRHSSGYRYRKPRALSAQVQHAANSYLRHGGKAGRRKLVSGLQRAVEATGQRFMLKSIHQIGHRHVRWHDEQLRRQGFSRKTREFYWRGWQQLWCWLNRLGEPPRPRF